MKILQHKDVGVTQLQDVLSIPLAVMKYLSKKSTKDGELILAYIFRLQPITEEMSQ